MIWPGGYSDKQIIRIFHDMGYSMKGDNIHDDYPVAFRASEIEDIPECLFCAIAPIVIEPRGDRLYLYAAQEYHTQREPILLNRVMLRSWMHFACAQMEENLKDGRNGLLRLKANDWCVFSKKLLVGFGVCYRKGIVYQPVDKSKVFFRREGKKHFIFPRNDAEQLDRAVDVMYRLCNETFRELFGDTWYESVPAPDRCFD